MDAAEQTVSGANPFQANYEILSHQHPRWGRVALLPWDEAIFGFPVADFVWGGVPPGLAAVGEFQGALVQFCRHTGAAVVAARAKGDDPVAPSLLVAAGFVPVDASLIAIRSRLKANQLAAARFPLRPAAPEDHEVIFRISASAFTYGRYHRDLSFPRALADQRYVEWVRRALADTTPGNHVFVLGRPGNVLGFMNVTVRNHLADLRLGAVDPENELGFAGYLLYAETLRAVEALGARTVVAKIAAGNTRVLNVCAALRFQFSHPETIFHWHPPGAAPLLQKSAAAVGQTALATLPGKR